ncbi:MAG TPA: F0F1 ATP synthase subunit gamma [Candidatus Faecimonas intestinavium]|nr:F0F1 ATP synthase subunit gamma [Candidatus Faecimonas intestinavium]
MASVKNIVKVMNFHALIRVEKARHVAEGYFSIEHELTRMIYQIVHNKNLNLDKKVLLTNKNGVVLNIYIGNDLGFCGNFNHQLQQVIREDSESIKVVVGKKIFSKSDSNIKMFITKESFFDDYPRLEQLIYDYVDKKELKEINVIYNHYYNVNDIRFEKKQLFPVELSDNEQEGINLNVDFAVEADIYKVLTSMISLYICYQIKILESNSWASENVMRERVTRESIDKIEELEEEKLQIEMKNKKYQAFKKQINNYKSVGE